MKMAVGIAALLIVFLGLEALVDLALAQLPTIGGTPLSITRILAWLTWPFAVLLGLRPEEWQIGADLLGSRFIETESRRLFQVGRCASHISSTALSAIPHGDDLCSLRIRACGEHGHLCRRYLRIGPASGKGYLAPGAAGSLDRLFDDIADRLYCRSPLLFLAGCGKRPPPAFSHRSEAQRTGQKYDSPLRSLRPCWTAFLRILHEYSTSSRSSISVTATWVKKGVFPQPARKQHSTIPSRKQREPNNGTDP